MLKEIEPVQMKASKPIDNKAIVLSYLKNGKHPSCAPMYYKDRETGKRAVPAVYLDDGTYTWSSDTTYHFEKYDYPLPQYFIDYVLEKSR